MLDTARHLFVVLHGWIAGTILLAGCPLLLAGVAGTTSAEPEATVRERRFIGAALWALVAAAWATTLAGTYLIYPWYRARPPAGTIDLANYPRFLLLSNPATAWWHSLGMEWKEHVSWLVPVILTMVAYLYSRQHAALVRHRPVRAFVLALTVVAFASTAVAAGFGLLLDRHARLHDLVAAH